VAGAAVGAPALGGVVYGAVNKAANLRGLAEANAHAAVLASKGYADQAKKLRDAVEEKAKELGLDGVPRGWWDGENIAKRHIDGITTTDTKGTITPTGRTVNTGPTAPPVNSGGNGSVNNGGNGGKSGTTTTPAGTSVNTGSINNGNDDSANAQNAVSRQGTAGADVGSEKDGSNRTGAFAKGGLVAKPKKRSSAKKSKAKVNSKKGLGLRTI